MVEKMALQLLRKMHKDYANQLEQLDEDSQHTEDEGVKSFLANECSRLVKALEDVEDQFHAHPDSRFAAPLEDEDEDSALASHARIDQRGREEEEEHEFKALLRQRLATRLKDAADALDHFASERGRPTPHDDEDEYGSPLDYHQGDPLLHNTTGTSFDQDSRNRAYGHARDLEDTDAEHLGKPIRKALQPTINLLDKLAKRHESKGDRGLSEDELLEISNHMGKRLIPLLKGVLDGSLDFDQMGEDEEAGAGDALYHKSLREIEKQNKVMSTELHGMTKTIDSLTRRWAAAVHKEQQRVEAGQQLHKSLVEANEKVRNARIAAYDLELAKTQEDAEQWQHVPPRGR
jgi:hypothetical protein